MQWPKKIKVINVMPFVGTSECEHALLTVFDKMHELAQKDNSKIKLPRSIQQGHYKRCKPAIPVERRGARMILKF
jgi:hypothetical protein